MQCSPSRASPTAAACCLHPRSQSVGVGLAQLWAWAEHMCGWVWGVDGCGVSICVDAGSVRFSHSRTVLCSPTPTPCMCGCGVNTYVCVGSTRLWVQAGCDPGFAFIELAYDPQSKRLLIQVSNKQIGLEDMERVGGNHTLQEIHRRHACKRTPFNPCYLSIDRTHGCTRSIHSCTHRHRHECSKQIIHTHTWPLSNAE